MAETSAGAAASRGEYRGLRGYRPGDDPRDIHWKTSARLTNPVVREYERDGAEATWIVLDVGGEPGDEAEIAVEVAASLAAAAAGQGKRFGLVAGDWRLEPGSGLGQLEAALDLLARVDFRPDARAPAPPAARERCVLVALSGRAAAGYGDAYVGAAA
ncbi:MAG: DUF58 domain-containing protein [Gemmatimonadetes bacterium]|nr:DUF58 domain-containing protein [Gemmatimonadota bacterium]